MPLSGHNFTLPDGQELCTSGTHNVPLEDVLSVRNAGKVSPYRAARHGKKQDQKWRRPMLCFCAMANVFSGFSTWIFLLQKILSDS